MIVTVAYAVCDGCGSRVTAANAPATWRTVQQAGADLGMYCTAECVAQPRLTAGEVVAAIAGQLGLTGRDVELLEHLGAGESNGEIANETGVALKTVRNRLSNRIYRVLNVEDRVQAVLIAGHLGLLDLDALGAEMRRTREAD